MIRAGSDQSIEWFAAEGEINPEARILSDKLSINQFVSFPGVNYILGEFYLWTQMLIFADRANSRFEPISDLLFSAVTAVHDHIAATKRLSSTAQSLPRAAILAYLSILVQSMWLSGIINIFQKVVF